MKAIPLKINRIINVLSQFLLSPKGRKVFLVSVIALAGALRMYRASMPIADNHSWRQTDSAAVIRNLAVEKFDLLRPRWNNLVATNGRGLPNPERYFFEDFRRPSSCFSFTGHNFLLINDCFLILFSRRNNRLSFGSFGSADICGLAVFGFLFAGRFPGGGA